MGLDGLHLRVLSMSSENEAERKNAAKGACQTCLGRGYLLFDHLLRPPVLKLLNKGRHWVLVVRSVLRSFCRRLMASQVLLLGNVVRISRNLKPLISPNVGLRS